MASRNKVNGFKFEGFDAQLKSSNSGHSLARASVVTPIAILINGMDYYLRLLWISNSSLDKQLKFTLDKQLKLVVNSLHAYGLTCLCAYMPLSLDSLHA